MQKHTVQFNRWWEGGWKGGQEHTTNRNDNISLLLHIRDSDRVELFQWPVIEGPMECVRGMGFELHLPNQELQETQETSGEVQK